LELIKDIDSRKELIETCFKKYGHEAEHCFYNFKSQQNDSDKFYFFHFKEGYGMPVVHYTNQLIWYFETEPLAPKDKRFDIIVKTMEHAFSFESTKKVLLETSPEMRLKLLKYARETNKYIVRRPCYVYYCPIYDLKKWDPALPGKSWKKMRNVLNAFKRDKKVEVVDSNVVDKTKLKKVIKDWEKNRTKQHETIENYHHYHSVDDGFANYKMARTVLVDGEPCSITAGWPVPNSKMYYSSLGVTNFKHDGLGEFSNIDDLNAIKAMGYEFAHFGGSDKSLLQFKMKFKPCRIEKEFLYYIVQKGGSEDRSVEERVGEDK
tara:strand:+ start:8709 stop:9668 length:960 start_codon:yes stop_codon:yes gene_type:complete